MPKSTFSCHDLGNLWVMIHEDKRLPTEHASFFKLSPDGKILDHIHLPPRSMQTLRQILNTVSN